MDIKKKYRRLLLWFLVLDLIGILCLGYRYVDRKIPNRIRVGRRENKDLTKLLQTPLVTLEKAVPVSGNGGFLMRSKLLGMIPYKNVKVTWTDQDSVFASGSTVGIYMETDGALIIDTGEIVSENGEKRIPAKDLVKPGDYIIGLNEQKISGKRDLIRDLKKLDGEQVTLQIRRDGDTLPVAVDPVKDAGGSYKLGIWVRDDTQGIGTLTFVDEKGKYGALGHGISDVDTGQLLNVNKGALYRAQILGIRKGSRGNPGELSGLIRYEPSNIIGNIISNTENGIYGNFTGDNAEICLRKMKIAYKQNMKLGAAKILSCVNGQVQEYDARITQIDMNHEDTNKSFVIQVTDKLLLDSTGGIVQGMSGSPVIQNGKLVGAVTHVFVNDPTRGYGIFIENMLEK